MAQRLRERPVRADPIQYDLTVEQAAEYLQRSRDFVYRLAQTRQVAFTKAGRELRFSHHDLDAYLASRRVEAEVSG